MVGIQQCAPCFVSIHRALTMEWRQCLISLKSIPVTMFEVMIFMRWTAKSPEKLQKKKLPTTSTQKKANKETFCSLLERNSKLNAWMLKLQMHFLNFKISDECNLIKRIINSRDFSGSTCGGIIEKVSLRNMAAKKSPKICPLLIQIRIFR